LKLNKPPAERSIFEIESGVVNRPTSLSTANGRGVCCLLFT